MVFVDGDEEGAEDGSLEGLKVGGGDGSKVGSEVGGGILILRLGALPAGMMAARTRARRARTIDGERAGPTRR